MILPSPLQAGARRVATNAAKPAIAKIAANINFFDGMRLIDAYSPLCRNHRRGAREG
jgi:hypothetical protein